MDMAKAIEDFAFMGHIVCIGQRGRKFFASLTCGVEMMNTGDTVEDAVYLLHKRYFGKDKT